MGVQSASVRLLMRDMASTNVMTTNTTQLAIDAAEWLVASRSQRASPGDASARADYVAARRRFIGLFLIMTGFLGGTICGALSYRWLGLSSLLAVITILAGIIGYCAWRAI